MTKPFQELSLAGTTSRSFRKPGGDRNRLFGAHVFFFICLLIALVLPFTFGAEPICHIHDANVLTERTCQPPLRLQYYTHSARRFDTLKTAFYPIGWSKEGLFAYIAEPPDEACGCYFFQFFIMNMTTNEVVWRWETVEELPVDSDSNQPMPCMSTVWDAHGEDFCERLRRCGIVQMKTFTLTKATISHQKRNYSLKLQTDRSDEEGFDVVTAIRIFAVADNLESLTVYKKKLEHSSVLHAEIAGLLKSPFGDWFAVIYMEETRGYEGPPHVLGFTPVGYSPGLDKTGDRDANGGK